MGQHQLFSASSSLSSGEKLNLPPEAAPGVTLLTRGNEALLSPHLVDALAWHLGASSVICGTAGKGAPGSFKEDMSPCMTDVKNVRYVESKRREAQEHLSVVIRGGAGADAFSPSYVVCVSQELALQREKDRDVQEAPRWLQLVKRLIMEVCGRWWQC